MLYDITQQQTYRVDVLNGIAHDSENDKLYITGKQWSKMFEVEVIEMDDEMVKKTGGVSGMRKRCIPRTRPLG